MAASNNPANPHHRRRDAIQVDLDSFEVDKEQINNRYFDLAPGMKVQGDTNSKVKDPLRIKSAETIKPGCASLKLTSSEFQTWAAKARGWVQQSNFTATDINVQHMYMTSVLDRETQQKVEAMAEYATADAYKVLKLVEKVHDTANPLFVKRSNFFAAYRGPNEASSAYITRAKVLAGLAKLSEMGELELGKFKVL